MVALLRPRSPKDIATQPISPVVYGDQAKMV